MPLRDVASYPPQEPLSEIGVRYVAELGKRNAGIDGEVFAYGDDPYQEVAVFRAAQPNGAVLAFMHGGGWTTGYKEWTAFMAPPLNAAGVTFVSIGYRLAPRVTWPTGAMDAARAVRWIHDHIGQHGGDPARLFLGGHSAGGHYATWLAVRDDWQQQVGVAADVIRGALPVSGVYDFTATGGMPLRPQFLGSDAANDRDASPRYTIAKTPPFFLTWGDRDIPHLIPQAEAMAAALQAAGGEVTTLAMAGCDHLETSYECAKTDGQWLAHALDWMASH